MEWRCEWCGKPHESDDPPCDNCGHGSFEAAVVQQPASADGAVETTEVWVCTACGREHVKHAPPCSRCGSDDLELREKSVEEADLTAPGYRDLLTPGYVIALALLIALSVVFLLGFVGVVDVPGFGDDEVPTVDDVPGNATAADGTSLAAIEVAYLDAVNEHRENRGNRSLERTDVLDDSATYYNQRLVKTVLQDGPEPTLDDLEDVLAGECEEVAVELDSQAQGETVDAEQAGLTFANTTTTRGQFVASDHWELTGVDVHSAEGSLFLTHFLCH